MENCLDSSVLNSNFRSIKYSKIVTYRSKAINDTLLGGAQNRFRKGRSYTDNIVASKPGESITW